MVFFDRCIIKYSFLLFFEIMRLFLVHEYEKSSLLYYLPFIFSFDIINHLYFLLGRQKERRKERGVSTVTACSAPEQRPTSETATCPRLALICPAIWDTVVLLCLHICVDRSRNWELIGQAELRCNLSEKTELKPCKKIQIFFIKY